MSNNRNYIVIIFAFFCFLFGYFFQGGGWNQNAHFDTIRAIAENGTLEITSFARNTGDVSIIDERIYSNKPPGLALLGAPVYYILSKIESCFSISVDSAIAVNMNAHILSFFLSGLPAVITVIFLFLTFLGKGFTRSESCWLSAGFGACTLALPFSGTIMSHNLVAMGLFASWYLIQGETNKNHILVAGLVLGFATTSEYLVIPLAGLFVVYSIFRHRLMGIWILIGLVVSGVVILLCNYWAFDSILATTYTHMASFSNEDLLFGMLGWPDYRRVYWLTIHPFRGLFITSPIFVLGLFAVNKSAERRFFSIDSIFPLLVFGYFFFFNLSFNGWTGGWSHGPRYLIPGLPFLYLYLGQAMVQIPKTVRAVIVVSAVLLVASTATLTNIPAPNGGMPPPRSPYSIVEVLAGKVNVAPEGYWYPMFDTLPEFFRGQISISSQSMLESSPTIPATERDRWDSYNLGELIGLSGMASLFPLLLASGFAVGVLFRIHRCPE